MSLIGQEYPYLMIYKGDRRKQRKCEYCRRNATYQLTRGETPDGYKDAIDICDLCLETEHADIDPPVVAALRPTGGEASD